MRRRHFLAATGCLPFAAAARARASAPQTVLRLGVTGGVTAPAGIAATACADPLLRTSDGRVRIEVYAVGEVGGELEITQDISSGALEMGCVSTAGYSSLDPALGVFDIPFLFRDAAHARAVLDGPIGQAALRRVEARGIVGLGWCEHGLRQLTTADAPVRTPRDLAGMTVRVPQSDVMLASFKAFGADARTLPFPDVYTALAARTFQAEENPLGLIIGSNFDKVQKYLNMTSHIYAVTMLMISGRAFDALDPPDRQALRDAGAAAVKASRDYNDRNDASSVAELRRRGMTIVTDVDRAAFAAALASLQPDFERQFGKDQLAAIRAFGK